MPSVLKMPSLKKNRNSSNYNRLGERKCSITSSLEDNDSSRSSKYIKTPPVSKFGEGKESNNMYDSIREEYFLGIPECKNRRPQKTKTFY